MSSQPLTGRAPLEQRLRAIHNRRMASRLRGASRLAAWMVGVVAVLSLVGAGLVNGH